jgi:SAM-dependent methyltransferase
MAPFKVPKDPFTIDAIMDAIHEQVVQCDARAKAQASVMGAPTVEEQVASCASPRASKAIAPASHEQAPKSRERAPTGPTHDRKALIETLALLARRLESEPEYRVRSHRPVVGRLIDPIKRAIHWGSRPYVDVVRRRQDDWNAATLHALRQVGSQFDAMEERLKTAEARLGASEDRLGASEERLLATEERLGAAEEQLLATEERLGAAAAQLLATGERLGASEARLGAAEERLRLMDSRQSLGTFNAAIPAERRLNAMDETRGTRDDINMRQKAYLDYFRDLPGQALDVGCGRGELLAMLRLNGIECWGADIDPLMVEVTRSTGAHAIQSDALGALRSVAPGTLGGVFAAQVIEHFFPGELLEFLALARQRLAPGGVMILETINPGSLGAMAKSYYRDLDHKQPLHPEGLKQLIEMAGFAAVEVHYINPFSAEETPPALPSPAEMEIGPKALDALERRFEAIEGLLYGMQDYYIVARQGEAPEGAGGGRR